MIQTDVELGFRVLEFKTLTFSFQGTVSTGQHEIWVKWAPPLERGRLTSVTLSGKYLIQAWLSPIFISLCHGLSERHLKTCALRC